MHVWPSGLSMKNMHNLGFRMFSYKKLVNVWFFNLKKKADRSDNGLIKNFIAVYFVALQGMGRPFSSLDPPIH